ncbi:MAG: Mut7-C RNAse domain-containing protein [Pirellulaceae bacterium]|nr:Mut7-C RNAse domain-containing protein [Pirellulaceae bacterium]
MDDRWHPRKRAHWNELLETSAPHSPPLDSPDFHCDAGLGGLAKLLRAAGYDAAFFPGIDDDRLLNITATTSAVLLTNDWRLSQRGVFQHGVVPCLHVPITMKKSEQLVFVAQQLQLERRATRCMSCGGRLDRVERESVRDRIPPRTYDWGVDIHRCDRCDKVFWEGGHWDRLSPMLAAMPLATTSLATTSLAGRSLEATSIARPVSQPPQQPSPPATIIEP